MKKIDYLGKDGENVEITDIPEQYLE